MTRVDGRGRGLDPDDVGTDEIGILVDGSGREVRYRSALAVAKVRIATLAAVLVTLVALGGLQGPPGRAPLAILAVHLALTGASFALLRARWRVPSVAFAAAVLDVAVVFVAIGVLPAGGLSVGLGLAAFELALLLAALSVPTGAFLALAALALSAHVVLEVGAGVPAHFVATGGALIAGFAAIGAWAGRRVVDLAARRAIEDYTGRLLRAHRDELQQANAQIAAQRDELAAARRHAESLTQLIVHDLKSPVAAMLQFVGLAHTAIARCPSCVEATAQLALAEEEGRRLSAMIGDLLLLSRLEAGLRARPEAVPVRLLLEVVARSFEPRAAERGARLLVEADADLVAAIDLDLARRLLENLTSNAVRHVRAGDRIALAGWRDGAALGLAVRNSGPPVAPEVRTRLFQKHTTGGRREWHNAGLGLYLCRLVAEAHGGEVALVERPGWGVSFEARLPGSGEIAA